MFNRSTCTVERTDPELFRTEVALLARRFPVYGPNAV
jgi:hypothetical protein